MISAVQRAICGSAIIASLNALIASPIQDKHGPVLTVIRRVLKKIRAVLIKIRAISIGGEVDVNQHIVKSLVTRQLLVTRRPNRQFRPVS